MGMRQVCWPPTLACAVGRCADCIHSATWKTRTAIGRELRVDRWSVAMRPLPARRRTVVALEPDPSLPIGQWRKRRR